MGGNMRASVFNKVIDENRHAWWATTIEELVKVQLFFDFLKQDFVNIDE